jgi:hypothetical protein
LNLEALKFWQRFVLPDHPQKLFQKHVPGYHEYSIYNNHKFAFQAAKNILFIYLLQQQWQFTADPL